MDLLGDPRTEKCRRMAEWNGNWTVGQLGNWVGVPSAVLEAMGRIRMKWCAQWMSSEGSVACSVLFPVELAPGNHLSAGLRRKTSGPCCRRE
jgi:hypothetical protein